MPHNKVKNTFLSAVNSVIANPNQFAVNPKKDFTRQRKEWAVIYSLRKITNRCTSQLNTKSVHSVRILAGYTEK